ncbi:dde superfamily endonuclease [Holotrichia oblita]|uniref:Dde superfamily endonuclease n=1 Tax=Holotrichia oblita TaxID=644536 RepID=A0ACB9SJL4_HOLOL|nr:dde superfamily endonuclease [Holotrichia oblita]
MKADEIGLVAKKDALIRHYGENYLKKHKRAQIMTACSNKLRECARLLIEVRRRTNNTVLTFFDMLNTNLFDSIVASSKTISGYEEDNKKFKAPSLAIHMGTTLKQICDLCSHLILKGVFKCTNIEEKLKDIKRLKHMIETQWNCEISSLAIKDLAENKWNKPIRLPLTKDVIKFRDYVIQISNENFNVLQTNKSNKNAFKILTESSLCLTILFNRRRIGDVQYVHVESYLKNFETMDQEEFSSVLTESEKVLTSTYKRVVAGGKGSRAITILFPKNLQKYIDLLLEIRRESDMVPNTNPYLFACPGIENQWIRADVAIRKLAYASGVENPQAISSNRLRKQIGTLMQIMNLSKEDYAQFAKFMGHTEKTHKEFYEITQDAYQTAKVSKLLALFDKGQGFEYKGKPLNDINLASLKEPESDIDEDIDIESSEAVTSTSNEQLPSTSQEFSEQSDISDDKSVIKQCKDKKSKTVKGENHPDAPDVEMQVIAIAEDEDIAGQSSVLSNNTNISDSSSKIACKECRKLKRRRCATKPKELKLRMKLKQANNLMTNYKFQRMLQRMPQNAATFIKCQIRQTGRQSRGHRFTTDENIRYNVSRRMCLFAYPPPGASIMVDRGFKHIQNLLARTGCKLIRPPGVQGQTKLSKKEVLETKRIASLRIHIERTIRRIREFKLLKPHSCINNKFVTGIDDAITIAAA